MTCGGITEQDRRCALQSVAMGLAEGGTGDAEGEQHSGQVVGGRRSEHAVSNLKR